MKACARFRESINNAKWGRSITNIAHGTDCLTSFGSIGASLVIFASTPRYLKRTGRYQFKAQTKASREVTYNVGRC